MRAKQDRSMAEELTSQKWERAKEIFEAALEQPPDRRSTFVVEACQGDGQLKAEVENLLAGEARVDGSFLNPVTRVSLFTDWPITQPIFRDHQVISRRFEILRFLGRGGMGEVYEARDLDLGERVALKAIRPEISSDPSMLRRFRHELQLARRVTHPNVCRLHHLDSYTLLPGDSGEQGAAIAFITMELLEGETLADRLRRCGRVSPDEAIPVACQMAEGLAAAHRVGVIHRDFKPGNVMLVPEKPAADARILSDQTTQSLGQGPIEPGMLEGMPPSSVRAVITDFGLAKPTQAAASIHDASSSLIAGRHVIGTPAYMAPEQLEGQPATPASDIYALGLVMYEMVTGQRPFTGDSKVTFALKHLNDEPKPPRDIAPNLDLIWDEAILGCLRKRPHERFQSAAEVKAALVQNGTKSRRRLLRRPLKRAMSVRLIASLSLILGLAVAFFAVFLRHPQVPPAVLDRSIAVLPFQESGGTPEYFSFGFTEEVMNALGQLPDLRVIGPETSFRFKSSELSVIDIGKKLNAHYLLIGSVHQVNHQIRVIVRLVDTRDGSQVWSRDMSRDERDVLLLRDDIARMLAREMNVSLSGPQLSGQPIDAAGLNARDLYWTGRFFFHQRTDDSVRASLEYFRQAVKRDANFAEAYCGIADALFVLAERGLLPPDKALTEARQAAHRAVELNNRLPAAYVSLAQVTSVYDRDLDGAEQLFRHALALDPKLAPGWQWLSYQLAKQRRFPEAVQAAEAAVSADPLSTAANINLAVVNLYAGFDDRAMQQSRKLAQMDPKSLFNYMIIALVFAHKGLFSEAIHELESVPEVYQDHPITLRVWVEVYAEAGMKEQAEQALRRLLARARRGGVPASFVASAYAAMGDKESAFTWLRRACDERDAFASVANAYPAFESIRSDPRWVPLMARFGIKAKKALDSSHPVSGGAPATQASPGLRTVDPVQAVGREAVTRAPAPVRPGFAVQGESDQLLEHRDPAAEHVPGQQVNSVPAAQELQPIWSRHHWALSV
jgi:eukaryotic-like serine/threonine-protein kinase